MAYNQGRLTLFIQGVKPSQHFTYVSKKSFYICGITVDDRRNLFCYLKASNADNKEIFLYGEEEILVNDVEDMDDAMLDNIVDYIAI